MKTFLIPTDFSDCAANAMRYAADYGASLKTDVHLVLLHVVGVQALMPDDYMTSNEVGLPRIYPDFAAEEAAELRKAAEIKLNQLQAELEQAGPLVRCSGHVVTGLFLEEVERLCKESQADALIMGTCGADSFAEKFFATNTYSVVKENLADVLVVPDGLRFRPYKTLVFAADLDENNTRELRRTIGYAAPSEARILVTHIEDYEAGEAAESELMSDLWEHVKSVSDYPAIDYQTVLANSIEEGITKVLDRESVDLLVMCPRQYSFLEGLLHNSHTRRMVEHPETVVLCLAQYDRAWNK